MKISSIAAALVMLLMVLALNACGDGKSNSGGAQQNNVQCAANQILNNGQCQACPANQTVVNNQCVLQCTANQIEQNGQCITPTPQCTGNQIVQNGSCVSCLEAQVPNIERTMCIDNRSQCLSTQIEQNGLCVDCPTGQFASGNRCTTPPPPPLNCTANQIEQNGMCVDCGANEMVSNNMCVPIPVTCTPRQIVVNNMCVDCGATQIITNNMCVDCPPGNVVVNNMCAVPNNDAPVVNAGGDQTIQLPTNMVNLSGTATDDGNPVPPGALTTAWSDTGPGTVTYGDASNTATTATFSAAGTYTLTLTADDGNLTTSDDLVVQVNAQFNNAPTVDSLVATPNSITLPTNMVSLTGTASDSDNFPNPLSFSWSSSPGGVTFNPGNALTTTATFPTSMSAVTYSIVLTASDGDKSGQRSVPVTVDPAPLPMCGGVVLNPGEVCVVNCNGRDLVFGDGSAVAHARTFANCGNTAINAGLNSMGHAITIQAGASCAGCH